MRALDEDSRPRQLRAVDAFDDFYRQEYRGVLKLAYVMSGRWSIAEDVTQEAFMQLLARWDSGELRRPDAWVRTVAVNLARSRLRRVAAEVRALARLAGESRQENLDPETADVAAFWAVVRGLPRRQGLAVALFYAEDRPVREVAELMGCAEGTVKALLHQARTRLADELDPDGGRLR